MAMALGIVGAVVSAVGSLAAGQAQANAASYNAAVAKQNRASVLEQTYTETEDMRAKQRKMLGTMRAAYGANGLEMSGSPLDVMSDTVSEMEYDVAKAKYVGEMKAKGYADQAKLFKMEASAAKTAGYIGAASALIGGVSNVVSGSSSFGSSMFASQQPQEHPLYGGYA